MNIWFRVWDDKTNRHWQYCFDGLGWIDLYAETRTTFLTHTVVGWGGSYGGSLSGWTATKLNFECLSFKYEDL